MSKPAFVRRTFTITNCLAAALLVVAGTVSTASAAEQVATVSQIAAQSTPAPTPSQIQVADEIIRRLRRLGINFNRARIPRPYDPEGELC